MANYPTSLDTFPNPTATTKEDAATFFHDVGHADLGDAVEGLEAKVGVDNSAVATSHEYRIKNLLEYPSATGGEDDDFMDDSFTGWTACEVEALTITELRGRASVVHPGGGASSKFSARLKAHTFATNDWIETAVRFSSGAAFNFPFFGLTMSNGTTHGTSNAVHWGCRGDSSTTPQLFRMTNNLFTGDAARTEYNISSMNASEIFLRWRYEGSNTFRGYTSPDGITWKDVTGAAAHTLTPTHWGFSLSSWGGASSYIVSFAYIKTGNG